MCWLLPVRRPKFWFFRLLDTYMVGKCCQDPGHITNFGTKEYEEEFGRASDAAESIAGSFDGKFIMLRLSDMFSNVDRSLSELSRGGGVTGVDCRRSGPPDVHIVSYIGDGEPAHSCIQPRLESIVPTGASIGRGNKGNLATPLWVTSQAGRPT